MWWVLGFGGFLLILTEVGIWMPGKGSCYNMQCIGRREHASTCSQCTAMCLRMVDISGHFVSKDECDVNYFGRMCVTVAGCLH